MQIGVSGDTKYDELLVLNGYGTASDKSNKCQYFKMGVREYVSELKLWASNLGLTHLSIVTTEGRELNEGVSRDGALSDLSKTLTFDQKK